jgi:hypothetical protein
MLENIMYENVMKCLEVLGKVSASLAVKSSLLGEGWFKF